MKLNENENQTEMFLNCNVILCKYMHQIINKFPVPGFFSFRNKSEMTTEKDDSKNSYTSYMHMFICPYHIHMA